MSTFFEEVKLAQPDAEALLSRALEMIPASAEERQATLADIFSGLYKGLFEPAREASEDETSKDQFIDSSQFEVFGAGAAVLRTLGVSRVIILGSLHSSPEFILEFNEPRHNQSTDPNIRLQSDQNGEAKTFSLANCLVKISGSQRFSNSERFPGVSLVLNIRNLSPTYLELWFAGQVIVQELDARSNKFLELRSLNCWLDSPANSIAPVRKSAKAAAPRKGVLTLAAVATGFDERGDLATAVRCRLDEVGIRTPLSKSELDNLYPIRMSYFVQENFDRAKSKLAAQVKVVKQMLEDEQPNRVAAFDKVQKTWQIFAQAEAKFSVLQYMSEDKEFFSGFCTNRLIELMEERSKVLKEFACFAEE